MPSIKRLLILVVAITPLLGFGSCQPRVTTPKEVIITIEKVPELTAKQKESLKDCPIEEKKNISVEEAVRVANARKGSLVDCNIDKKEIRSWFDKP